MSLVSRAQNILFRPNTEWTVVAAEPATPASILAGYVVPLAAIGPIASFIGLSIVGVGIPFVASYRMGFVPGIINAVMSYVFAILAVFLVAAIINVLAPSFGAQKSFTGAFKVTAYSFTPSFVAGILAIVPPLAILGILAGLYGIYLLFTGLPAVMGATKEKAPIYALSVVGCAIVIGIIFGSVTTAVRLGTMAMGGGFAGLATGSNGSADTSAAQNAASQLVGSAMGGSQQSQQAAQQTVNAIASAAASAAAESDAADKSGDPQAQANAGMSMLKSIVTGNKHVAVVPRDQLTSLLPTQLGDMPQSNVQASTKSIAGVTGAGASADYKDAAGTLELSVADLGNAGGIALLAGTAANYVQSEDNEGYERNVDVGGEKVHESWKNATKHSELFEIIDSRFAISATGDGIDMDTAVKGLQEIDPAKLRAMAASAASAPSPAAT